MSTLFVCGERPGHEEEQRGEPFVGASGGWIDKGLGMARGGADRLWPPFEKPPACAGCHLEHKGGPFVPGVGSFDQVFVSNVRKCMYEDETPAERETSVAHCARAYLEAELVRAAPRALLLVGGDALKTISGLKDTERYHASVWTRAEVDEIRRALGHSGVPALPPTLHTISVTLHPAYAMRAGLPQLRPSITLAVARALRWAGRPAGPARDWTFNLEPTPDDLAAYLDTREPVAVDVETPHDDFECIELCGFSARDGHAMVVEWREPYIEITRAFLGRGDVRKVLHNGAFDRKAFAAYGIKVAPPVWDTIQAAALLHPPFRGAEKHRWLNLFTCAARLIDGLPNWKDTERSETRALYRAAYPRVPNFMHPKLYNAADVIVTRRLRDAQEIVLREEGMIDLFDQIVCPASEVLFALEQRGMPLDEQRRAEVRDRTEKRRNALKEAITSAADAFHQTRRAKIESGIARMCNERATLFVKWRTNAIDRCTDHHKFTGLSKPRRACIECDLLWNKQKRERAPIDDLRKWITKAKGLLKRLGPAFRTGSPDDWRAWLFSVEGLGLVPIDRTPKTQKPSIDDDSIEALWKRHPEVGVLRQRVELA